MYHLVLMTWTLAVLSQALHSLVDESYVLLIDVKPQQPQTPCGAAADAVQELKRLTHQIIVVLVILVAQKVLEKDINKIKIQRCMYFCDVIAMYNVVCHISLKATNNGGISSRWWVFHRVKTWHIFL